MMYGMGDSMDWLGWLVLVLMVLGIAALIKYMMSGRK